MKLSHSVFMFSSILMLSVSPVLPTMVQADATFNTNNANNNTTNNNNVTNQQLVQQTKLTQTNNQTTTHQTAPSNGFTVYQNGNTNDDNTNNTDTNTNTTTTTTTSSASDSSASSSSASSAPSYSNYTNDYGFSHFTRYNLEHMQDGITTAAQNPIGDFSKSKISDLPSAIDIRPGVEGQKMNVWDSWPLQDANGHEVTYKGYHLVFALAGNPNKDYTLASGQKIQDAHIFLFYQKVSDEHKGISSWKNAGQVFNSATEGSTNPSETLQTQLAQWSGETILTKDNKIRLFYTSFNGSSNTDWQALATAQIAVNVTKKGVSINHKKNTDNKIIATADGKTYQTLGQAADDGYDENVFRDVHYFEYKGKSYITFAANTTDNNGLEGVNALYNTAYLGGNKVFQTAQQNLLVPSDSNPWHKPGTDYNAVIGVAELNANYTVKKFKQPILGFNTITDEFERPNIFEHNGKWYLFGITRGYKLATPNVHNTDSYLIGFVANSPFGKWKPLNKNGLVVRNTRAWGSRKYSYSFYILNSQGKSNRMVMTSYMTNAKLPVGHQTFSPSMIVNLNGDKATVEKKVLQQGQLVK